VCEAEIERALSARPRLQYKRAAQQALARVAAGQVAALVTAAQAGELSGKGLAQRVITLAGNTS
jgi:hypothetical protein